MRLAAALALLPALALAQDAPGVRETWRERPSPEQFARVAEDGFAVALSGKRWDFVLTRLEVCEAEKARTAALETLAAARAEQVAALRDELAETRKALDAERAERVKWQARALEPRHRVTFALGGFAAGLALAEVYQ